MYNLGKLRQAICWFRKQLSPNGIILMYHRVAEVGLDPWSLCVSPTHFAEHLDVVKNYGQAIHLRHLIQAHQCGDIPPRSVIFTFDDGYADNLYMAKPILEEYNVPSTVFLISGQIGDDREFWWDELEGLLLQTGQLPEKLSLIIKGYTHHWELGDAANYSEEDHQQDVRRKAWDGQPGSRLFLYYSLWKLLRPLLQSERRQILNKLATWANTEVTLGSSRRSLAANEVYTLEEGGLIEIGAHTVTHALLSEHSVEFQREEITNSKARLEELLGHPVNSFSYPHGEFTEETEKIIQEAGFVCACSTVASSVWRKSDCFRLPRFEVENWNGKDFAKRLRSWFHR